ncbi:MAG TPA: type II toxin-antitoxin system RelE/ParE family toxin [Pirellulaceae bacterium]|jgi:plasmid stabilization system protein ParE
MKLRLTKRALREFDQAVDWFRTKRPWLVDRFLDDIRAAFDQISRTPQKLPRVEVKVGNTKREWRRRLLKRFSYIVVFFISNDTVVVCTVSHTSRDWTSQLTDREE